MYAPKGRSKPVCAPGDFPVGVIGLDHGHIYGMCNGLTEAGAEITLVYDSDPAKVAQFQQAFPSAKAAASKDEVYASNVKMIASASIPLDRGPLGVEAMRHGKDFFVDKPPLITLEHLEQVRQTVRETGQKFFCYFSERLHVEGSVYAQQLLEQGKIGKVVQVMGWGPTAWALRAVVRTGFLRKMFTAASSRTSVVTRSSRSYSFPEPKMPASCTAAQATTIIRAAPDSRTLATA